MFKENKENIPLNINPREIIPSTRNINNTIMCFNHNISNISPNYKRTNERTKKVKFNFL